MSDIDLLIDDDEDQDSQSKKYLMFNLGNEEYGIDYIIKLKERVDFLEERIEKLINEGKE